MIGKMWRALVENFLVLAKSGSFEILKASYKSIEQMVSKCPTHIHQQIENTWEVYVESIAWAANEKPAAGSRAKPLLIKLIDPAIESLRALFSSAAQCEFLLSDKCLSQLYDLLRKMIESVSTSGIIVSDIAQLVSEEREVFDFIEYLPSVFKSTANYVNYFVFLLGFLEFDAKKPHSDAFVRRALVVIKNSIMSPSLDNEMMKELIQNLYSKLAAIIGLRFNNEANKVLLANAKELPPLWFSAGKYFLSLSAFLLNPQQHANALEDSPHKTPPANIKELPEATQELVWHRIIDISKEILNGNEYDRLDRGAIEETWKKSEELGIMVVDFAVKVLLPNSESRSVQKTLVHVVDGGCEAGAKEVGSSFVNRPEIGLSQFCILSLIRLCNNKEENQKLLSIKVKLASITTRVLVNRCKKMLQQYIADEKRNAQVPLPRYSRL